jgi:hypothetical protein
MLGIKLDQDVWNLSYLKRASLGEVTSLDIITLSVGHFLHKVISEIIKVLSWKSDLRVE